MTLDVKLYKALRTGLGDKAAKLLANRESPYALKPLDINNGPYSTVAINSLFGSLQRYGSREQEILDFQDGQDASSLVPMPLPAGTVLSVKHEVWPPAEDDSTHPALFRLRLGLGKVADANGIPIAPVFTTLDGSRAADGTVTRPASVTGFAVSAHISPTAGFNVTVANAGWYTLSAASIRG